MKDDGLPQPQGWEPHSSSEKILPDVFQTGVRTGQKADPLSVSNAMRRAKHSDGSSIFDKWDYWTPPQRIFLSLIMEDNRDEPGNKEKLVRHELETEKAIEEMMSEVTKKFALQHFIKYAKYIVSVSQSFQYEICKRSVPPWN